MGITERILRVGEGRKYKKVASVAKEVGEFEAEIKELSDAELRAKTDEFRGRIESGETLDDLLVEAYAVVREASMRVIGQRHFDVQINGAVVLHRGSIAEMRTGEGKTLVSTMPVYLNALSGEGVHVATHNPYLAKRDAEWMGSIYKFLGLTVGLLQPSDPPPGSEARRAAYQSDVTYGTANEFGFDYLRDNMVKDLRHYVQRGHSFAIVDEVDSILIDEARTPLIISGPTEESAKWYRTFAGVVARLRRDDHYEVDEAKRTVAVTEDGIARVEEVLGIENLYDEVQNHLLHYLDSALRAKELFRRDRDYMVQNREVLIVDEFTGRTLPGRRWSDGLHQAVEARENVPIQQEDQTLATITLQNYFRLYEKLSGMTGTAKTQAAEFANVYKLEVYEIPTNQPMVREDSPDVVYKTEDAKWKSVAEDLAERNALGQPCLVGTISIEKSEVLARYLDKRGVSYEILNAKNHEREAFVVAQAGRLGAVTVATNMAGRGVDILLGGNPEYLAREEMSARGYDIDAYLLGMMTDEERRAYEAEYEPILEAKEAECATEHDRVIELGGLYVLGTERHESRRIDNQLRGRSGRQGDPGETRFYLSLEDDLMQFFATGLISGAMERFNIPDDVPIEARMVSRAIERAQSQVESRNFEIRKNVLKYDDVMNKQREIIYGERRRILDSSESAAAGGNGQEAQRTLSDQAIDLVEETTKRTLSDQAIDLVEETTKRTLAAYVNPESHSDEWDWEGLETAITQIYPSEAVVKLNSPDATYEGVIEEFAEEAIDHYTKRRDKIGSEQFAELERQVFLGVLDNRWREHLYEMDYLREGIGLRAYAQKDPLIEYQREAFEMFEGMREAVADDFVRYMFRAELARSSQQSSGRTVESHASEGALGQARREAGDVGQDARTDTGAIRSSKVPRNAPCPCGSGRKYKKCHGAEV